LEETISIIAIIERRRKFAQLLYFVPITCMHVQLFLDNFVCCISWSSLHIHTHTHTQTHTNRYPAYEKPSTSHWSD